MITFKPLEASHLPLLHDWLNRAHLRTFYQPKPVTMTEVTEKYLPVIEKHKPTNSHIVYHEGNPFGYIQCYKNADWPKYAADIGVATGLSVDLFIGEPEMLGQGLGHRMLRSYVEGVAFGLCGETEAYICHAASNLLAQRCSERAGFSYLRDVVEEGKPLKLFKFNV